MGKDTNENSDKDDTMLGYGVIAIIGLIIYFWVSYGGSIEDYTQTKEYKKDLAISMKIEQQREQEKASNPPQTFSRNDNSHEVYLDYVERFKALASFKAPQEDRCTRML